MAAPITLTKAQYLKTPAAKKGAYTQYLRFLAKNRPIRMAQNRAAGAAAASRPAAPPGPPPFAGYSDPQIQQMARGQSFDLANQQIDALTRALTGKAMNQIGGIQQFGRTLQTGLQPYAHVGAPYGAAAGAVSGLAGAARSGLASQGSSLAAELATKLAGIQAPAAAVTQVAGGAQQTGEAAGAAAGALGSADVARLQGSEASGNQYGAALPGIAQLEALQREGLVRRGLSDQLLETIGNLQVQAAKDYAAQVQHYQDQNLTIRQQAVAQANADRNYGLALRRADQAAAVAVARLKQSGAIAQDRSDQGWARINQSKDKFTPKVGSDGSITAVYGDGRVVALSGPGTVPQKVAGPGWSTKVLPDGSMIQTSSRTGEIIQIKPPGTIKKPANASGPTAPALRAASKLAYDLYHGVLKKGAPANSTNPSDWTILPVDYQTAFNKLRALKLSVPDVQAILNSGDLWQPGETGRPYLTIQERQALVRAGVSKQQVAKATFDAKLSAQLKQNYPGAIAKANQGAGQGSPPFGGRTTGASFPAGDSGYPLATRSATLIGRPYQGTHTLYGNWESDNAIDIPAARGTPVYAVADGVIGSQIGSLGKGGNLAGDRVHLVTAGNEFYYAHLQSYVVKPGQRVRRGQLIGYTGALNHLHIGAKNGNPVDIFGYGKAGASV